MDRSYCHNAPLKETPRTFRNGSNHVEGRCATCGKFVKFIPHEESQIFTSFDPEDETFLGLTYTGKAFRG